VLFLLAGLVFPVYASRQVGLAAVLHPGFGFIVGFVLAALVVGLLVRRIKPPTPLRLFALGLLGTLVIYLTGFIHVFFVLRWITGTVRAFGTVLSLFMLPYLIGDLLKCAAAALAAPPILKAIGGRPWISEDKPRTPVR
jgi:biotin transport system substrate-specific component